MPAWEIKTMNGSEPLSVSGTENFPYRSGASGSEVIVPFFSSSLPLEYDINEITINIDGNDVVLEAPSGEGNQLRDLKRLSFINDQFTDSFSMRLQEDPDEYARVLSGDDEIIAKDIPKIDPSYVEYFLSIKVDDEIDGLEGDVKVRGETLYQGGASDPVDPCEDV